MCNHLYDICIVGGGASGMAAAIAVKQNNADASVLVLEKKEKPGSKLLATGNGRCNLTNANCPGVAATLIFFRGLGILTREEDQGRIYPRSGQAADVRQALVRAMEVQGVEVRTGCSVTGIDHLGGRFAIMSDGKTFAAKQLLLATGGKAAPQFGCTGDGFGMARSLGHRVNKTIPALSPLECEEDFTLLKGTRARALVRLMCGDREISREEGEVQFTEYGLSGICVFNLSRYVRVDGCSIKDYRVVLDLAEDLSISELREEIDFRRRIPGFAAEEEILSSIVPGALTKYIADKTKGTELAQVVKNLPFSVQGVKGWKLAQCTSGGISSEEYDQTTMESRRVKGLFFAGELLDYDGPCGGYNLQHAWETGLRAGKAMADNVL